MTRARGRPKHLASAPPAARPLLAACCVLMLLGCRSAPPRPRVVLGVEPRMFPSSWLEPDIAAWAKPLEPAEEQRSLRLVRLAMSKYPDELLSQNLEAVYVVGELGFRGIHAGGTNAPGRIFQANGSAKHEYTDEFIESTFHHELSSILLREHPELLDEDRWHACNPAGFHYADGGVEAVKRGADSVSWDETLHHEGFLCEYARSSLEEDFNTIAEALFMNPKGFWLVVSRHPPLAAKVDLAIAFYASLSPIYSHEWFRSLPTP